MASVWKTWRNRGLAARIVSASLALLLVVQLLGFAMVRQSISDNARQQIGHELAVGERVWQRLLDQNAEKLNLGATVLASDYAFREAIGSGDVETIRSALNNHGARIGAGTTAYFDAQMQLVATGEASQAPAAALTELAGALQDAKQTSRLGVVGRLPHQFVMAPVRAPLVVGWVLMGFPIDQKLADEVNQLIDAHVAIVVSDRSATDQAVGLSPVVSTLGPDARLPAALPQLTQGGQTAVVAIAGQEMLVKPLTRTDWPPGASAWLLRSVDAVVAPFVRLQQLLLGVTALGLLLFAGGSVWLAGRVTRPLAALLASTKRLQAGDFDTPVPQPEQDDEVGRLSLAFDVMRRSVAQQRAEITRLAFWDTLTGLPNREQFRRAVEAGVAEGAPASAVLTLNLDRFKHVNDVLGHHMGDAVLQEVARRLSRVLRSPRDLAARLEGDGFGLWLSPADQAQAEAVAAQVSRELSEPLHLDGQTVDISASLGLACWPAHADSAGNLLIRSEMAMHIAKTRSSGLVVYSPELDTSSEQNLSLLSELRHAVEQSELRLFLQPKVAVATGQVVGAEALVRWQHPQRGLVAPAVFIPFAEKTGFIRVLTFWVLEAVARHWQVIQSAGAGLRVAVNLSTRDLLDATFADRLGQLLEVHRVPATGVCLEITESAIMDDPQRAQATLNQLAERGFKLSIDDFGTGYSSLAYLKSLPVSELKIDRSFVMSMTQNASDAQIVRSTIDLAHNLGLSVVAEGVEDAASLQALRDLGCDEVQGYYISRPVPVDAFAATCARWQQALGSAV